MKLLLDEEWNIYSIDYKKNKMSSYKINDIKVLFERLKSLQIMNETLSVLGAVHTGVEVCGMDLEMTVVATTRHKVQRSHNKQIS